MSNNVELTDRQQQAMDCLTLEGPRGTTARGFAEFAGLTRDSASGALNRLVKMGLVRRETGIGGNPTVFYALDHDAEEAPQATQAYDKGWMAGYEQGRAAGLKERTGPDLMVLHSRARDEGIAAGKRLLGKDILTLVARMQQEMREGAPVHIHNKTCWKDNAACSLNSVRKLVERETGLVEEIFQPVAPYVENPRNQARRRGA